MTNKNLEDRWKVLKGTLDEAIKSTIPQVKQPTETRKKKLPLWTNEKALTKVKKKREAYRRYIETREGKDYLCYAKARNQAKQACRRAVQLHEQNIARNAKKNPKAFYAYARSKLQTRDGIADLEDEKGNKATTNEEKAAMLNAFFCSVFTKENLEDIPELENKEVKEALGAIEINEEDVVKKLKALKINKSPGPDELHPRVLREAAEELAKPVTLLFQQSIQEGKLPQIWKDANVTPLFKKGSKSNPGNYRPVSLTCILCKVLESIIRDKLVKHMLENNLLSKHQHGFISGRSSSTNLLTVLDAWTEALDNSTPIDAIYLDFAKAFDSVPHERLARKLKMYGVTGSALIWIQQFLSNRRQCVRVEDAFSSWKPVTSGIPQGSVLGPVLFVIFINDLPEVTESFVEMFADDTKIYMPLKNEADSAKLQQDIHNLTDWATKWQLRFNASKCKTLHLGNNNPQKSYVMKNEHDVLTTLEKTELEKDLGINIDPSLKFSQHIEKQVNKANRILGLIRRSYQHLDKDSFKHLFTALVRPHLEYCNVAWAPRLVKDKKLIEGVLRRGSKCVPGLRELSYEDRLKTLNIPSMTYRRARGDMIEVYKYTHELYNVNQILQPNTDNTRRGHNFKLQKRSCKTATRKNFFSYRIVNAWNSLPSHVVNAPTMNSFKSRLDKLWNEYKFTTELPDPLPQTNLEESVEEYEEIADRLVA